MQTQEVAGAVAEWVQEKLDWLRASYDFAPTGKPGGLPDVVVELAQQEDVLEHPSFPFATIQQRHHRVWTLNISIMVDNGDPQAAARLVESAADALAASLLSDGNLGGRVPLASPFSTWDFTNPFVQYQDGVRGRELEGVIFVAELVEA